MAKLFQQTETTDFISQVVKAGDVDVLIEWSSYKEKERNELLDKVHEAISFTYQSLYQATTDIVSKPKQITPLQMIQMANSIKSAKSKADVNASAQKHHIEQKEYSLQEIKPLFENSWDMLIKMFMCISYSDAYLYVQMGKILNTVDKAKIGANLQSLIESHVEISMLLTWFRLAARVDFDKTYIERDPAIDSKRNDLYPTADVVITVVSTAVDIIEDMKFMPPVITKMLRDTDDINRFFVTIDAIIVNLTDKSTDKELGIRRRVAFMYLMRDIFDRTIQIREYLRTIELLGSPG